MPRTILSTALMLSLVLTIQSVTAADEPPPRSITVSGVAEVQVAPNEVVISLGVETFAQTLEAARNANNERTRKLLAAAETFGLDAGSVSTGHVQISLRYQYVDGAYRYDQLAGYDVERSASLKLSDITKLEPLMSAVLDGGANKVHGLDFRTSELRKHRDEARRLALVAAREKAVHMAGVLDQKVGRPLRIVETDDDDSGRWWSNRQSTNSYSNMRSIAPGDSVSSDTFAPGSLTVKAGVSVEFELQ